MLTFLSQLKYTRPISFFSGWLCVTLRTPETSQFIGKTRRKKNEGTLRSHPYNRLVTPLKVFVVERVSSSGEGIGSNFDARIHILAEYCINCTGW